MQAEPGKGKIRRAGLRRRATGAHGVDNLTPDVDFVVRLDIDGIIQILVRLTRAAQRPARGLPVGGDLATDR